MNCCDRNSEGTTDRPPFPTYTRTINNYCCYYYIESSSLHLKRLAHWTISFLPLTINSWNHCLLLIYSCTSILVFFFFASVVFFSFVTSRDANAMNLWINSTFRQITIRLWKVLVSYLSCVLVIEGVRTPVSSKRLFGMLCHNWKSIWIIRSYCSILFHEKSDIVRL